LSPNVVNVPVLSKQHVSILPAYSTLSALLPVIPYFPNLIKLAVLQRLKNIGIDGGIDQTMLSKNRRTKISVENSIGMYLNNINP
jgi:hypothetical protein